MKSETLDEIASRAEEELRRELVRFSRWLSRLGFTPGTSGNLSVRIGENRLLSTPTGVSKGLIRAADIVLADLQGHLISGTRKVTSELSMHLAVYEEREDVTAVIHCHPPVSTAFACSGRGLEEMLCQEAVMTVGAIPLARYATTGTDAVAQSLRPYIMDHEAILLENHGAVSYGTSLLDAFMKMETVEHLAQVALVAHQLGSARPLQADQLQELRRAKAKYIANAKAAESRKAVSSEECVEQPAEVLI